MFIGANKHIADRFGDSPSDHTTDTHTLKAFEATYLEVSNNGMYLSMSIYICIFIYPCTYLMLLVIKGSLPFKALLCVFSYLSVKEVCRAACVSGISYLIILSNSLSCDNDLF
jgi:hypothetical protein